MVETNKESVPLSRLFLNYPTTTAGQASGRNADLECRKSGKFVYAVEVKERAINLSDVIALDEKLSRTRLT